MDHLFNPSSYSMEQQRRQQQQQQQEQEQEEVQPQQEEYFHALSERARSLGFKNPQSLVGFLRAHTPRLEDLLPSSGTDTTPQLIDLCLHLQSQITHLKAEISLLWSHVKRFPAMAIPTPTPSFPGMAMPATSFPGMAMPGIRGGPDVRLAGMEGSLDMVNGESPNLGPAESSTNRFPGQGSSSSGSINLNLNPNSFNHRSGQLMRFSDSEKDHEHSVVEKPIDNKLAHLASQMISEKDLPIKNAIFDEVKAHIAELMGNPNGNGHVKKFFDRCDLNQKDQLVREVTGNAVIFAKLCLDPHGVLSVNQMLKSVADPAQITQIFKALRPLVCRLMTDMNAAKHVLETCAGNHPVEFREYLLDEIVKHFVSISKDRHGCNSVRKCIMLAKEETRERLISEILRNALLLAQDEYGNHVVGWLLKTGPPHVPDAILQQFKGSFLLLSLQRFSCNVVKLLVQKLSREKLQEVKDEISLNPDGFPMLLYICNTMDVVNSAV
ncbi:hypothetical protein Sjap_016470 [Stephania japonica]|uniref:PUM-HD domain-containing protein n=1 Tax=Stephania japonica TaxID=461633 RepID=A0AAP0IL43_9MAGN